MTDCLSIPRTTFTLAVSVYYTYNLIAWLRFPYTDHHAFELLTCCILLSLIVSSAATPRSRQIILYGLCASTFFVSVYACMQFQGMDFFPTFQNAFYSRIEGRSRSFSTLGHPDLLGGFYVAMLPVMIALFRLNVRAKKLVAASFLGMTIMLAVVGLFFSQSRSAWLAVTFSCILLAILSIRRTWLQIIKVRAFLVIGIILLLIIVSSSAFYVFHTFTSLTDTTTLGTRWQFYQNAWDMISKSPIWGTGFGTFRVYYPWHQNNRLAAQLGEMLGPLRLEHPHNEHLEILSDTGIVGYLFFLWIIIEALRKFWFPHTLLDRTLAVAIVGLLCDGLFSQNLRYIGISALFWLFLGFANIQNTPHAGIPSSIRLPLPLKLLGGIAIAAVLLISLRGAYSWMRADVFVRQGMLQHEQHHYSEAIAWFKLVLQRDARNFRARYYLAYAYQMTHQNDEALAQYLQLQQQDPNFLYLNYHLATLYLARQDAAKAKDYLIHQIAIDNMHWQSYYQLALLENYLKNPQQAIAYLQGIEPIHALKPLDAESYLQVQKTLAQLYIDQSDWKRALNLLERIKKLAPQESWIDSTMKRIEDAMR